MSKWIDDQVAMKPTLHRAYYRRRVNPRIDQKQAVRPACMASQLVSVGAWTGLCIFSATKLLLADGYSHRAMRCNVSMAPLRIHN